jgi:diguanylate cyclase (GGDEF)-like protein/putative nucleotidyltransferase with HDIG domain
MSSHVAEPPVVAAPIKSSLPVQAVVYLVVVLGTAIALGARFIFDVHSGHLSTEQWVTFAVLATASALAQLFVVITPRNQSYHMTIVFLVPAAFLLPPELLPVMAVVQHVPEWLKQRYAWYIQSFNIANYTLDLFAAWAIANLLLDADWLIGDESVRTGATWVAAAVVFVLANHVLLATMLHLGRGHSWRTSGLFSFESLSTDLVLAAIGVLVTAMWLTNQWLVALALAPLILIHRSLSIPVLEEEARVDPKTGLFNTRHFTATLGEELDRATRLQRPLSLLMIDLDLLREINNSYGHLAGDAVLQGIAGVFRRELRHCDLPARFGGEEFCILLPETPQEEAVEVAERIRRAVAASEFVVETSTEPIHATISIGVAAFPGDGTKANELIHQADVAVYDAKLQGRNRVLVAGSGQSPPAADARVPLAAVPAEEHRPPVETALAAGPDEPAAAPQPEPATSLLSLSAPLAAFVACVAALGAFAGVAGLMLGRRDDLVGIVAIAVLVGVGQLLALKVPDGSISVSAVGALAGAALFGPSVALALAVTTATVDWITQRPSFHRLAFNVGALSIASLCAAGVFDHLPPTGLWIPLAGLGAGLAYFAANTGLLSVALALETRSRGWSVWRERFAWLMPHYLVYGLIGGAIALGYAALGTYAIVVFAIPLVLMRRTQAAYLAHTRRSLEKLGDAAATIQRQNSSLEQANRQLQERSLAAMESLVATVDARDSYTAGHSRRVQSLALAVGREFGLSAPELDVLGSAALFHDIGKLAVPDSILLKPATLTAEEWESMQTHADEGARIIARLGFLRAAVPAIRHHHENWDGSGYPSGLVAEEIPLGARIIHVVDAVDTMLSSRPYRAARPLDEVMREVRAGAGTQFCPLCVRALESVIASQPVVEEQQMPPARLALAHAI